MCFSRRKHAYSDSLTLKMLERYLMRNANVFARMLYRQSFHLHLIFEEP